MSAEELMSSQEKRFLDDLLQHYNLLATEAKKKHPHVKEACETGIMRVRNASSSRMLAAMGLRAAMNGESQQILEPFFMGCDTKAPKMVQISINAMQKMIIFECINLPASASLIICLWNLMEHGIEEVKILQTVTLLVTTNQLVMSEQLAKLISLCFRLHYTKNATTNNTASATIRQMVTMIFERVQNEDKKEQQKQTQTPATTTAGSSHSSEDVSPKKLDKLFGSVSGSNSSRFKPVKLRPAAEDAFNFLQDLIQIINGEAPFWLTAHDQHQHLVEIAKTFGLELLELIIDQYADVFHKHEEFAFLLKEKVCQLVIKLFSPNIKQRGGAQFSSLLSPLLSKSSPASSSGNNSSNSSGNGVSSSSSSSSSTSSASSAASSMAQSVQVSSSPIWPITVRLMPIVSVLIRNFFEMLVTESEIFLSLLVKSLEVDKANWQRSIALEALYRMIQPSLISSLCKNYDMKPQSSKILRDIVNALCIYIQSQFQVVDSSTTTSLLTSLVNNTNSGNPSVGFINSGTAQQGGNNANQSGSSRNSAFPIFNLRGISISLLFIPFHKVHRYRTFYIEQLEKPEPPLAPEGHGLSTALACILEIVSTLTKIIENDIGQSIDSQLTSNRNAASRQVSVSKLSQETRDLHENLLNSTFCGFTGTFSLLLDASTDEVITELLLEQMRKLISLYGLYNQSLARDSVLISMCKSSLPGTYYQVPALNPNNLAFDASFLPKPANDSLPNTSQLSFSSLSQYSISNAAINLPNLLSQQNNSQPSASQANINPNNPIVTTSISSMDNPCHSSSSQADFSRQIIAVGTPMPTAANSGTATSSTQAQGPVMLTSKNLQCMNSILAVSNSYGYVYEEKSWHIVFTSLQHLVWILGLKPNNLGVYRLGQQQQQKASTLTNASQLASSEVPTPTSPSSAGTGPNGQMSLLTNAAISDLPMLTSMLSRLFECTQYLEDEALIRLIKALIVLSNESLEVAYNNREPSLFAVVKLLETGLVNIPRINLIWSLVMTHLIEVSSHPFNKLREWGVDVLCNLVKSVLTQPAATEEAEKAESDRTQDESTDLSPTGTSVTSQSYYLEALQALSSIKFVDIRQKQIECCLQLLQANGENITDGWPIIFAIIESACSLQNENLVRCAFQCYQFVISDLLTHIPPVYLMDCINTAVAFGSQLQELNVSLTAVGLIWNVADFLHSNQAKIQYSLEEWVKNGHQFVAITVEMPFSEGLTPFQSLWISLFKNLSNLCTDARLSVRKSSGQTLFSTLSTHGASLEPNPWQAIFFYVLFPLIDSVRTLCSVASNERITYSESSMNKPNTYGVDGNAEYIIHYSRNTAFKQWCETQVLVLNGISRILCLKLDLFMHSTIAQVGSPVIASDSGDSTASTASQGTNSDNENMLLNIWSLFFDFIYTSAVTNNAEVSTSALKSFNEIVHFLGEYHKTKAEAVSTAVNMEAAKAIVRTLYPVWKIVWKTWCNIGHNIGPNKLQSPPLTASDGSSTTTENGGHPGAGPLAHQPNTAAQVLQQLPSQAFLCLLIKPLFYIFPKIASHFTDGDFKNLSFVIQNAIATPFINEPSVYNFVSSDQSLTQLQVEVLSVLERMQEQILGNLTALGHLLALLYYQYLALSLYAVNIIPPHLSVFIGAQFQHRFLPGELTQFNVPSFYVFGERALKNAFNLYLSTYKEPVVIKAHILHSLIKAYKIPLCFKYSCPQQSTWKYTVNYFIKTMELGLSLSRKYPNDFMSIWADLALTFEGFLFPMNKPPTGQSMDEQQIDESLDVKVVEVIRDNIMLYAQQIPKEFLLQIVSILNRGSIHSPSITSSIETEMNRKLREDFARVCFQTLLQFSFFGPKGSPDLFIQASSTPAKPPSPEHSIGIVNKLAVASILKRFNDVIVKYVEDEQLCPCPLPRHRLSEISFVLKALATLITSLKEAPSGSVETAVWKQLIDLYPKIVDCTMSNSPQVNKSIREVLHEYAYLLTCPSLMGGHLTDKSTSSSSISSDSSSTTTTNGQAGHSKAIKTTTGKNKSASNKSALANGQTEVQI